MVSGLFRGQFRDHRVAAMRIWVVHPYSSIPGEGLRPDRPSMVGEALARAGHDVTWWGSNFQHRGKILRSTDWQDINIMPGYTIRLVPTPVYRANVSIGRIRFEWEFGRQVLRRARQYPAPDVVILGEPALFSCRHVVRLVDQCGAKLVLDRLDLWPEFFHMVLPRPLRGLGRLVFSPLYARRKALFRRADAVTAVCDSYLRQAQELAPGLPAELCATIYYGIDVAELRAEMSSSIELPPSVRNLVKKQNEVWAICATSLGNNYDIETLLRAGQILEGWNANVRLLIAGVGPLQEFVASFIDRNRLQRTLYIGNPAADVLSRVYSRCDVGLSAYRRDSTVAMPIKAFNYFAAGLAVVNSLRGDLASLLETHRAGMPYESENALSLAEVLRALAEDPAWRRTIARNSYDLASQFDRRPQYAKFVELVRKLGEPGKTG